MKYVIIQIVDLAKGYRDTYLDYRGDNMNIGALILMGGKNSRMDGSIKGLLKINGITFLEQIKKNLCGFSNIYLSLNKNFSNEEIEKYKKMGLKVIVDIYDEIGPMGGIYSALKNCEEEYLFITACDMPFINNDLINNLISYVNDDVDVVLFSKENRIYPMGAIYSKRLITHLEELIENKDYKLKTLINKSRSREILMEETDISNDVFNNINTIEEYNKLIKNH